MTYTWKCSRCGETVDVHRRVLDYLVGPRGKETQHKGCDGAEFYKIVTNGQMIKVLEYEDTPTGRWPI